MFFCLLTITLIFYVSAIALFVEGFVLYGGILFVLGVACTIILLKYYRKETKESCVDCPMYPTPDCKTLEKKSDWDCGEFDCGMPDCFNCN
jgi:hypothetical protein